MLRVDALEAIQLQDPSTVTIGAFDGVHIGHQYLIKQLVTNAHANGRQAVVMSFYPHPDDLLRGLNGPYYLTSIPEKTLQMKLLGVDVLVIQPFDENLRQMRAAAYVERLQHHLGMVDLWATADFALGYQREGTIDFLRLLGMEKGFSVSTIDHLTPESRSERVSSTLIRGALQDGDVMLANRWLGRPYRVSGEVVRGAGRGRTIGIPTANVAAWERLLLPQVGVYACFAHVGGERFLAVTNIGVRPTFDGQGLTVEAHLLDFDRDIYGQELSLDFMARLRGEQKFSGIEALVAQIKQDAAQARALLHTLV